VLAAAGLVATRLMMAKSILRRGELAIFRAVGAPRGALMMRQLLEAALLAGLAAVGGAAVGGASAFVYNRVVGDTDIPLVITSPAFGLMAASTIAVGSIAAIYPAWRAAARRPTTALMRI
jgi:putative ABC transport system permease protein